MTRKIRSDSKLHRLPPADRAKVDRWLFDKALSYQQVADACLESFNLKISRSSVARYFERETQARLAEQKQARYLADHAHEIAAISALTPDQRYHLLINRISDLAMRLMEAPAEERDHRAICRFVRILIAARRERHLADRAAVHRAQFELWAAAQVLDQYWHSQGSKHRPGRDELRRRKLRTITWREQRRFTNPKPRVAQASGLRVRTASRRPTALEWDLAERNGFNTLHFPPPALTHAARTKP